MFFARPNLYVAIVFEIRKTILYLFVTLTAWGMFLSKREYEGTRVAKDHTYTHIHAMLQMSSYF